jgi:DNA-binding transcriptional MerR regulator
MNKKFFILHELAAKARVTEEQIREWEKLGLVRPSGTTDEDVPLFAEPTLERIGHIQKLIDMGYGLEEIQKIVKKVGIPKQEHEKAKGKSLDQFLTVGTLAEQVGVSPRTIKHWEDKGIIDPDMRSEGGFRLYSKAYVYLCKLIQDLQLLGFTLEEIKTISDYFRDFMDLQKTMESTPKREVARKLDTMLKEIDVFFNKTELFKKGIQRWEDLLKKKKKEIINLKNQNAKRPKGSKGETHA